MQMKTALIALAMSATVFAGASKAQTWRQVGPPGGTVITLAADPTNIHKLYLGTADGHVFTSVDEGGHWQLLSRIGTGQDDVITHIIVDSRDSKKLYASTWALYTGGGGVYRSDDAGQTWKLIGLAHETVRALAQSPIHPNLWVAGSLTGVYRSLDDGANWERISPANHPDLRNFDSVAFDPKDDNIIYAGTYHLPWKTANGGKDWFPIVKGMIDDSDVMNIIVDPANTDNVHAVACSGIYHSTNAGTDWVKYKSIPNVYRRTQLIRMDPSNPEILYAGTTSGLWKTVNEKDFRRLTPVDWVINALIIDPKDPKKLIIGTEREGVQISRDGGETFAAANVGFQHQHISDVAMDREHPERTLVELTFDTDAFLETRDGGVNWTNLGPGLRRTETRHIYAAPNGWWAALTNGGWMRYEEGAHKWVRTGLIETETTATVTTTTKGKKGPVRKNQVVHKTKTEMNPYQVEDMAFSHDVWFAATSGGVLESRNSGATWKLASKDAQLKKPAQSVEASADGSQVWAIAEKNLYYSNDKGATWEGKELSFAAAGNLKIHRLDATTLFITTNLGLYASRDAGRSWNREEVRDLSFQSVAGSGNALVVSLQKRGLIASYDGGKTWQHLDDQLSQGYFPVVTTGRDGSVVAVSATEGILSMEPGAKSASTSSGAGMR
ncbi:MAG TPA: YCF48-related protein [Candidatus Eisenbacteria bacterium]|nr:YCF48-related protein [Candidatus Eisenbacteria bacterium]